MMKGIGFFILLTTVAATASAGSEGVAAASADSNLHPGTASRVGAPVVTEKYEYYEIRGDSEEGLRRQLCENGCRWNDGKRYDSLTRWHWKLDYGYARSPRACSADTFRVRLEVTFRFPAWSPADNIPQPLREKWERYMNNLTMHENRHRDMAVEAASALSRAVADLPPASNCAELDREVRALGRERMEKLNADEKEYDELTSHGRTQGAVFP